MCAFEDVTEAARHTHATWDEVADMFVAEMDLSKIVLKLNMAAKETKEEIYAVYEVRSSLFLFPRLLRG